ncbi:hypothetical protein FOL47_000688 [Perkinsus chesapeaki]|uniref:Uncharacterized protein n=1 Tax=Perkinsus chesapeaki TaxID=330153 RepID=A0A7J6MLE4_PERCH|nr:hypothetical protein FOL47_000688 [Perkinsus chesapeaki]
MAYPVRLVVLFSLIAMSYCDSTQDAACMSACSGIPGCDQTYCKSWKTPANCFGIHIKSDGTPCYAPADATCAGDELPCDQAEVAPVPPATGPSVSDILGSWCGTSPYPGGDYRLTFDETSVLLSIAQKVYTADYELVGSEIRLSNFDAEFQKLLQALGTEPYAEYQTGGVLIRFDGIFSDVASRC